MLFKWRQLPSIETAVYVENCFSQISGAVEPKIRRQAEGRDLNLDLTKKAVGFVLVNDSSLGRPPATVQAAGICWCLPL